MAEVEKLQPEVAAMLSKQRLVLLEADVAPGVEIEIGEPVGHGRDGPVIRGGREFAGPLDDVVVAEGRRGSLRRRLGVDGSDKASAGRSGDADEQRATGQFRHGKSFGKNQIGQRS